ncbi:MAG TPA: CRTAC1 family protein [Vicinamibacterales bacterium]|nr:CRTAC1 family protein [Vicinamibacterales bacterium]
MIRRAVAPIAAAALIQAAAPRFEPIQPEALSAAGTLVNAFADIDGDGDLDLFVGFNGTPNRLYRNDRGIFADVADKAGVADARATRSAAWGDFDADGDPDLLLGFAGSGPVLRLYRNDGGRFEDVTAAAGLIVDKGAVRQPVWIDVDGDADLDLFVAFRDRPNAFFRNERGTFTDAAQALGLADARRSVGAVWFDYDEDGDLDLYVGNMDGDANGLYRNDSGKFADVADHSGVAWGGRAAKEASNGTVRPCAADVDGDGRLDLFAANYGPMGLFLNRGAGRFDDVSGTWGVGIDARYDACAFSDFDHDGRLDLYVNGTVTGGVSYRDHLFRNTGSAFEDVTPELLLKLEADHGVQWADVDGDGDEDLALTGAGKQPMPLLFRNMLPPADARRSTRVRVLDGRGRAVLAGAEVRVFAAGTRRLLGTRLVDSGSGYNAQSDVPVHIGLAASARVDVEVIYPALGQRTVTRMANVEMGKRRDVLTISVRR